MTYPHVSARGAIGNTLLLLSVVIGSASVISSINSAMPRLAVVVSVLFLVIVFGIPPTPAPAAVRRLTERLLRTGVRARPDLRPRHERTRRHHAEPPRPYLTPVELPPQPAAFVGRHQELDEIRQYLAGQGQGPHVVVIRGADGIGKTTVAVAAAASLAERYPKGRLYAELSRCVGPHGARREDDALVTSTIESFVVALKKPDERLCDAPKQPEQFQELCTRGPVLIVLDDVDDVEVVRRLLPEDPGCAVIVTTSRIDLRWPDKWQVLGLDALDADDSRKLLQAIAPGPGTDDDATALRLVAPMSGHPNAIRLAATQIALRSASGYDVTHQDPTAELAARLEQRWAATGDPAGIRPAAALRVSFGLLGADERSAVRAAGGLPSRWFTEPALTAKLGWSEARVGRTIRRLLAAGYAFRQNDDRTGVPIFGMSADIYAFARERNADSTHEAAEPAPGAPLSGGNDPESLAAEALRLLDAGQLPAALAIARRAVERTVDVGPVRGSTALAVLADIRGELGAMAPAADQARAVIALGDAAAVPATVRAMRVLARLERRQNRLAEAEAWLKRAVDLARHYEAAPELILCLRDRAVVEALGGTGGGGRASLAEAFTECRRQPDAGADLIAGLYWAQSTVLEKGGAPDDAMSSLERGERAALRRAQRVWLGWIANRYSQLLITAEKWDDAKDQAVRALHTFAAERHPYGRAHAALILGRIHLLQAAGADQPLQAAARHQARLRLREARQELADLGDPFGAWQAAELGAQAADPAPADPNRSRLAEV